MTTIPYILNGELIDLVPKTEHDAVVAELENQVTFFVNASYEIADERNKLRADNAELLERLEERTQSHLHASARDVQTIRQQAVELRAVKAALSGRTVSCSQCNELARENAELKATLHLICESQQRILALSDKLLEQNLK